MTDDLAFLVCLGQLPDDSSRGFSLALHDRSLEGFLVKKDAEVFAYINRCPHTGAPLDWTPHQFLDSEATYIQCAMHGALFQIETGRCVAGPCIDQYLEPLPLVIRDGKVFLRRRG